ncbi:cadmium resistance transporter [Levilactobacillus bambusae]|uniref:Permease n=1 Tax=Levilactobacillus bambusae TaxID=2024736 RepID=A0A2V1N126_9LACO|nr:cadmium resistance transporter [Levilactobacillus bambusae]PWG00448.1 permease [Levilactobacillus bambusae]
MLTALGTALLSYLGTTSDYFVILLLVFGLYRGRLARPVFVGAYLGNFILVAVSLIIADVLKLVPEEWLLGLLGVIPIYMGITGFFSTDDEEEKAAETLAKANPNRIISNVILITVATCGADNMAMYIPFFATTKTAYVPAILLLFVLVLTVIIFAAYYLTLMPLVHAFFEKFGQTATSLIYIVLGLYVLIDSGTISHLVSLL